MKRKTKDPDAIAFIKAAGITDATHLFAIIYLVVSLKQYGLWDKMLAIYPFIGGTATTHKYNLKDPRDLNVAFRLTFSGGLTHNAFGVLPNGSTGLANTNLNCAKSLLLNDTHISYYSRTNNNDATGRRDMGGNGNNIDILMQFNGDLVFDINSNVNTHTHINKSNYYAICSRTSATNQKGYVNGVLTNDAVAAPTSLANATIRLFNIATGGYAGNRQVAFSTIGRGLSDIDASNLYNIVQQYQTILNRAV